MKKIFTNSDDVIHLFAQRTQDEAKCGNVFFNDKRSIYSYGQHYLLGEFIDDKTIVINDEGYSVTTSKHISQIRYATRQYKQFFKTSTDLQMVYDSVMRNKRALVNARKPEMYIGSIFGLWNSLNEFIDYTKAKVKRDSRYKEIKAIIKALNESPEDFKEKVKLLAIKQAKAKAREAARQLKEVLPKFMNHEINSFRVGDEDYVRLSEDGTQVETSQHISVDRKDAKTLYGLIKRGINIKGHRIGYYNVTSINGTLIIGCHNINMESVHQLGKVL